MASGDLHVSSVVALAKVPRGVGTYFRENSESLALGYLASALRRAGHDTIVFDGALRGLPLDQAQRELLTLVENKIPGLVGFTIADATYLEPTFSSIQLLRGAGYAGHITIGGHAPTFNYLGTLTMSPGLDSVVRFEGERTLVELVRRLGRGEGWRSCPGIAYRASDGAVQANPPECPEQDLDSYAWPARDYLPYVLDELRDIGIVAMAGSRGCYQNCGFCSIRRFYDIPGCAPWRQRSVGDIFAEIDSLMAQRPDIREIVFVDDIFTGPAGIRKRRLAQFEDAVAAYPWKLMFSISERVDNIDEETAASLRRIGVRQVLLGLESGDPEILKTMNKHIDINDHRRAIDLLRKNGIDNACAFITFTPWSTLEQIRHDAHYFHDLGINVIQGLFNRFQVYDGTPIADELRREGRVVGEFPHFDFVSSDPRCDKAYALLCRHCGVVLELAYKLKRVERELRFASFEAESTGGAAASREIGETASAYWSCHRGVMRDVVKLFDAILDLADTDTTIEDSERTLSRQVQSLFDPWMDIVCCFLGSNSRYLSAV